MKIYKVACRGRAAKSLTQKSIRLRWKLDLVDSVPGAHKVQEPFQVKSKSLLFFQIINTGEMCSLWVSC